MLNWSLFKYTLFDIALLNSRFSGKQFGTSVPNPKSILNEYRSLDKYDIHNSFVSSMKQLFQEISVLNENIYLIIFPPYWALTEEGTFLPEIQHDFLQCVCLQEPSTLYKKVIFHE